MERAPVANAFNALRGEPQAGVVRIGAAAMGGAHFPGPAPRRRQISDMTPAAVVEEVAAALTTTQAAPGGTVVEMAMVAVSVNKRREAVTVAAGVEVAVVNAEAADVAAVPMEANAMAAGTARGLMTPARSKLRWGWADMQYEPEPDEGDEQAENKAEGSGQLEGASLRLAQQL